MATDRRCALLCAVLVAPFAARADEVDATSTTLLAGRPEARDGEIHSVVPIWEILSLRVSDVSAGPIEDLRIVLAGWGEVQDDSTAGSASGDGDLDLAYVEGSLWKGRLHLRLGRQLLLGGGGRMTGFDGLSVDGRVWRGLGITVSGGIPVTPRFNVDQGDALAAARVYWRQSIDAELGLSYTHVLDKGLIDRADAGVDGRLVLSRTWSLGAFALWSVVEARLAEADLAATWQPRAAVHVVVDAMRTAPDLFLPRSSILSVFSQETRDEAGVLVSLRPAHALRLEADLHILDEEDGWGARAAARAELVAGPAGGLTGLELRVLTLPSDGYEQARLFGRAPLVRGVTGTVDVDLYRLDQAINDTHFSLSMTAAIVWELPHDWTLVTSGLIASDPLYERRIDLMAKLVHSATFHVASKRP